MIENVRRKYVAATPSLSLSSVVTALHEQALRRESTVSSVLRDMVRLNSDSWGVHFAYLIGAPDGVRDIARDLLDMAYTAVVAQSVGVDRCNFRGYSDEAVEIMSGAIPRGERYDGIAEDIVEHEPVLRTVGWQELAELRRRTVDLATTETERLALSSKMLAHASMQTGSWYSFAPRAIDALYSGFLWAGIPGIVYQATGESPGFFVTGFIPAALGAIYSWRQKLEGMLSIRRERRYFAILQDRSQR